MEGNPVGCFTQVIQNSEAGSIPKCKLADGVDIWSAEVVSGVQVIRRVSLDPEFSRE
jgi:hypothetical protein